MAVDDGDADDRAPSVRASAAGRLRQPLEELAWRLVPLLTVAPPAVRTSLREAGVKVLVAGRAAATPSAPLLQPAAAPPPGLRAAAGRFEPALASSRVLPAVVAVAGRGTTARRDVLQQTYARLTLADSLDAALAQPCDAVLLVAPDASVAPGLVAELVERLVLAPDASVAEAPASPGAPALAALVRADEARIARHAVRPGWERVDLPALLDGRSTGWSGSAGEVVLDRSLDTWVADQLGDALRRTGLRVRRGAAAAGVRLHVVPSGGDPSSVLLRWRAADDAPWGGSVLPLAPWAAASGAARRVAAAPGARVGVRPRLGCHLHPGSSPPDLAAIRALALRNPGVELAFLHEHPRTQAAVVPAADLPNVSDLGTAPLGQPVGIYGTFDAVWCPPTARPAHADIVHVALACSLGLPLLVELGSPATPWVPVQHRYRPGTDLLDAFPFPAPDVGVLDAYLRRWSADGAASSVRRTAALLQVRPRQAAARCTPPAPPVRVAPRRLKCVLAADSLGAGGLEAVVALLAHALPASGIDPVVLCYREGGETADRLRRDGLPVVVAGCSPARAGEVLAGEGVAVMHSHQAPAELLQLAARRDIPVLETVHGSYLWHDRRAWRAEHARSAWFSLAAAVSEAVREAYQRGNPGFPSERLRVIPNGVDPWPPLVGRQWAREALDLPLDSVVLVSLGRFDPVKNQLGLITAFDRAASRLPDRRMVLLVAGEVGDPLYRTRVDRVHRGLRNAEAIRLSGPVVSAHALSAADAFVVSSIAEGWSLAATEALMAGLPLLHTACGSGPELVGNGRGLLVGNPAGSTRPLGRRDIARWSFRRVQRNTEALAAAIVAVVEQSGSWDRRRPAIRGYAAGHFHSAAMSAAYAAAYRSLSATGPVRP